eukprot:c6550_g1_i1.p1 GENE.c6550_g1_i1~~c6550_g1_i1.p1  ORF type:complete len:138 (+),score=14.32 c6550_g1_i1:346-759(+)
MYLFSLYVNFFVFVLLRLCSLMCKYIFISSVIFFRKFIGESMICVLDWMFMIVGFGILFFCFQEPHKKPQKAQQKIVFLKSQPTLSLFLFLHNKQASKYRMHTHRHAHTNILVIFTNKKNVRSFFGHCKSQPRNKRQ